MKSKLPIRKKRKKTSTRSSPIRASLGDLAGRYEFYGTTDKGNPSDKFWEITFISGTYQVCYGKNGTDGVIADRRLSGVEALKKCQEKISKGYQLVGNNNRQSVKKRTKTEVKDDFDFLEELRRLG